MYVFRGPVVQMWESSTFLCPLCLACVCVCLSDPHSRPGARDLAVVWGCKRGGGGFPRLTRNLGATQSQLRRLGRGSIACAPSLAGHREAATMAQGGLHRGVAVSRDVRGLPVVLPTPGLVCLLSSPPAPPFALHKGSWGHGRTRLECGIMKGFVGGPSASCWPPWE